MPNFRYKVRDKYGRPFSGVMTGANREGVIDQLKSTGYAPILIEEIKESYIRKGLFERLRGVSQEDLIMFTRQLVTLQSAGLPLLVSLGAIKEQAENGLLKSAITQVIMDIEAGSNFSDALSKHARIFDGLYVNMVKAGEAGGILDSVLERLATLKEYDLDTSMKMKAAARYPLIVVITLAAAFIVIVTFVLPRFADLFTRFNVELPLPTRILLGASYLLRRWWFVLAPAAAALAFLLSALIKLPQGRIVWDGVKLQLPVFGRLNLKISISRFARVTSELIKSGIPLLQVLELSSKAAGNVILVNAIEQIRRSVNEGRPMNESMRTSRLFPPIVTQMVAVGESTGKLDDLLGRVSEYYDKQVDHALKNLTTAIEPILIFCLGLMILTMALAIFLPLWGIIQVFKR